MLNLYTVRDNGPSPGASVAIMMRALKDHDPSIPSPTFADLPSPCALHWPKSVEGHMIIVEKGGAERVVDPAQLEKHNVVWLMPESIAVIKVKNESWTMSVAPNGEVSLAPGVHLTGLSGLPEGAGTLELAASRWLKEGEVGASSKTLCHALTGLPMDFSPSSYSHPWDPSDLLRCVKLLQAIPELRPRLGEMRPVSAEWASLVDQWDDLEGMLLQEIEQGRSAPRTAERMRQILRPRPAAAPAL